MASTLFKKMLDNHAGYVLVGVCFCIIVAFIIIGKPFDRASPQPTPTPTPKTNPSGTAVVNGIVDVNCTSCDQTTILSAYDIAVYTSNTPTPIAQSPLTKNGQFHLELPAGTYTAKTIPAIDNVSETFSVQVNHTANIHLTIPNSSP